MGIIAEDTPFFKLEKKGRERSCETDTDQAKESSGADQRSQKRSGKTVNAKKRAGQSGKKDSRKGQAA